MERSRRRLNGMLVRRGPVMAGLLMALTFFLSPLAALAAADETETAAGTAAPLTRELQRAEEMARQGVERLLGSLDQLAHAIPQYGMPRIDENGDIVIPRKRNPPDAAPSPDRPNQRDPPFNDGGDT